MLVAVIEPPQIIAWTTSQSESVSSPGSVTQELDRVYGCCWYDLPMQNPHAIHQPRLRQVLERVLIGSGLLLLLIWGGFTLWGQLSSRQQVADFDASLAIPDQPVWSDNETQTYRESLEAEPDAAIGVLRIAQLDLEVPLFEGVNEFNLNRGVARIEGTALLQEADNLGIAGHRDSFFRPLKDVTVGAVIELSSHAGTRRYQVVETLIVEPEDVWVLDPASRATLTLVTCYPFYFVGNAPQRFIVRADLIPGDV